MKVIVDTFGGDKAPDSMLQGAFLAMQQDNDFEVIFVGDKDVLEQKLSLYSTPLYMELKKRVEILHASENIDCSESPVTAIKNKPNSSIVLGCEALRKRADCGAFVSAGSTGAILTGAVLKVGRILGVSRPALCPMLCTKTGKVMVIDVGANMDCKVINLVHFALMGSIYMRALGIPNPRVALVNVGTEETKGNELTHAVYEILEKLKDRKKINFVGNMEARDAFSGDYDVLVCDGFVGNVLLKTTEGTLSFTMSKVKGAMRGFPGVLGKLILAPKLLKMKRELSEETVGGSIFLGANKPVVKAHGNSSANAFCNAVLVGARAARLNLGEQIKEAVAAAGINEGS